MSGKNPADAARREFLQSAGAAALAAAARPGWLDAAGIFRGSASGLGAEDTSAIRAEIEKRHEEALGRLQSWIKQPSIAAENRGMKEGCEMMMELLRDAGFEQVRKMPTDGQPGVFASLDAGAPKTLG